VLDVVSALGFGEAFQEFAAGFPEEVDGASLDRLEEPFELAERLFDRIEVWTIRRRRRERGPWR
jgi:hypothetical protein